MLEELLRIDKLPTLRELRFLLMEVLTEETAVEWYALATACRSHSLNLSFSFENAVKLLKAISLISIDESENLRSEVTRQQRSMIKDDRSFCLFITKRLIEYIERSGLLSYLFNPLTVKFESIENPIILNIGLIPLEYPMIKVYLLNMGIVQPDRNIHSILLVNGNYKEFFIEEILNIKHAKISPLSVEEPTFAYERLELDSQAKSVSVFISYSHMDEPLKVELQKHFSGLVNLGIIKAWHDGMILPGSEWDLEIKKQLEGADIVIFLISSDLMASDYINNVEIPRAIDRFHKTLTKIIPVIARPCDFASIPLLNKFQALPKGAKPISLWDNQDEAFLDVVLEFKRVLMVQ